MRSPPHLDLIQQSREPWGRTRTHVEVEGGVLMTGRRLRDWRHDRILGSVVSETEKDRYTCDESVQPDYELACGDER